MSILTVRNFLIATGVFGVGTFSILLATKEKEFELKNLPTCAKTSLDVLKQKPAALKILGGDEIKTGWPSLTGGWDSLKANDVSMRMLVKGKSDKGYLYTYARRENPEEKFKMYKMEVVFDSVKDKKMVIWQSGDELNASASMDINVSDLRQQKHIE